jgi:glycosyltransferase involved in cell wall biosynthesis
MQISVVIPVLNEEKYIEPLIRNLLDGITIDVEILVYDAGSKDRTAEIVTNLGTEFPQVHLIVNKEKFVSYAFNHAFTVAKGKYMALLGAHALYPKGYLQKGFTELESGSCDVVGGPLHQDAYTPAGKGIAFAMSSKLGVGGTAFRTEQKRMYVQSVAFAIYRKSIFEKVGLLDTALIRNQDDELHYRMHDAGFKLLMIPEMKCTYYVRDSIVKLWKQYFEYGLYKPLVFAKVKSGFRLRHIIPSIFCLYILSIPLAWFHIIWMLPLALYVLAVTLHSMLNGLSFLSKCTAMVAFPTLHLSYGLGFLIGLPNYFNYQK